MPLHQPVASTRSTPHLPHPRYLTALLQAAVLAAFPDGGQVAARRNAWAGMSRDVARARARREAEAALAGSAPVAAGRDETGRSRVAAHR